MIGSALSAWLKDGDISRSSIGLFGVLFAAYSINFLWSPLLDRIKLPVLHTLRSTAVDIPDPMGCDHQLFEHGMFTA